MNFMYTFANPASAGVFFISNDVNDETIRKSNEFQEKFFESEIIR